MNAIARMAVLDLRTVAPYRNQGLAVFGLMVVLFVNKPTAFLPVLVLLLTSTYAAYPFNVAEKAGLETLYAVLPLPRRSVLYGHYIWAMACFLATVAVGTPVALILARSQSMPFSGHTLAMVLAAAWALFAVNVSIQFPLFIRFGYTRINALSTTLPLAVIMLTIVKLHLTIASIENWLPLVWVAGAAAIVASTAVAMSVDRQRGHRPGRQQR